MCTAARNPLLAGYSASTDKRYFINFQCLKGFQRAICSYKNYASPQTQSQQAFSGCAGRVIFVGYKFLINKETT